MIPKHPKGVYVRKSDFILPLEKRMEERIHRKAVEQSAELLGKSFRQTENLLISHISL